ncbi:hypothetical protein ACJJTC_001619 [Scirpophaga incertulas]
MEDTPEIHILCECKPLYQYRSWSLVGYLIFPDKIRTSSPKAIVNSMIGVGLGEIVQKCCNAWYLRCIIFVGTYRIPSALRKQQDYVGFSVNVRGRVPAKALWCDHVHPRRVPLIEKWSRQETKRPQVLGNSVEHFDHNIVGVCLPIVTVSQLSKKGKAGDPLGRPRDLCPSSEFRLDKDPCPSRKTLRARQLREHL